MISTQLLNVDANLTDNHASLLTATKPELSVYAQLSWTIGILITGCSDPRNTFGSCPIGTS